jgi:hypothetical protein
MCWLESRLAATETAAATTIPSTASPIHVAFEDKAEREWLCGGTLMQSNDRCWSESAGKTWAKGR